jgi:hypothetical protein
MRNRRHPITTPQRRTFRVTATFRSRLRFALGNDGIYVDRALTT